MENEFVKTLDDSTRTNPTPYLEKDLEKDREMLTKKTIVVMDNYTASNLEENKTRFDYTVAGIALSYNAVLPKGVNFLIDFRQKSRRSFQKTADKEIANNSVDKISKDIYAMRIVITDVDENIEFDASDPANAKIIELQKKRLDNIKFIRDTKEWLKSPIRTEDSFYKKLIELLERLEASTYPECTDEIEAPYGERLEKAIETYSRKKSLGTLSLSLEKVQTSEMETLLGCLTRRLEDKLEQEILKVYTPRALNTNLMRDRLKTTFEIEDEKEKHPKIKENGYVADFYILNINDNFLAELQGQSYARYIVGKSGSAYHNGIVGKELKIDSFFELVDKNDPHPLEYYLDFLDQIPVSTFDDFETMRQDENSSDLINSIKEAYSHIKIKDAIELNNEKNTPDAAKHSYDMNKYLIDLSTYVSAEMSTCRLANNYSVPTVIIENSDLPDAFSDVLRKRDGISCLAQLLVDRVNDIVSQPDFKNTSLYARPSKTINVGDIRKYCDTLPKNVEHSSDEYSK